MKIVFIIASLEGFGGTNRVATLLANALSNRYQVSILSKKCGKNAYDLESSVRDIKFETNDFKFLKQCKTYIKVNNPDIVIVHTMSKLTVALLLSGLRPKNFWSLEHISFEFHNYCFKYLRRKLYKKLDKVITLTHEDAEKYYFNKDVHTIANMSSLDISDDVNRQASKKVVAIGRLTHQKGFDLLVKAWSIVENNHSNWILEIYGEGEDKPKLEEMIKEFALQNVRLMGVTEDIKSIYDSASIYVMSSRYEGFGMVLIEAQSRGLPIVSFNCPSGPAEIISNNIDGYLVRNGDIRALAEKITYLIENEETRYKFSDNALISAQRFQPAVVIRQWEDLLESERAYNG